MNGILITGAAGGIGRALCLRLAKAGQPLFAVDLPGSAMEELTRLLASRGVAVVPVPVDLAAPEAARQVVEALAGCRLDVCIHAAGYNEVGRFAAMPADCLERVVAVNLTAPMAITAKLLAGGRLGDRASVVFFSSLSSFVGYPGATAYSAAKEGIASYARSLRLSLGGAGMHVMTVYPGPTRTPMAARCSPMESTSAAERRMTPEAVAAAVERGLRRRSARVVPGWRNRAFALAGRLAPALTEAAMRRAIYERIEDDRRYSSLPPGQ